jgi:hypothetical protein
MGGGPRRTWFRLLAQLASTRVRAFCGAKDDPELVWNLREVEHLVPKLKLDFALTLDPEAGHALPLKGIDGVAAVVRDTTALDPPVARAGTLLADAINVESPILRIDAATGASRSRRACRWTPRPRPTRSGAPRSRRWRTRSRSSAGRSKRGRTRRS